MKKAERKIAHLWWAKKPGKLGWEQLSNFAWLHIDDLSKEELNDIIFMITEARANGCPPKVFEVVK